MLPNKCTTNNLSKALAYLDRSQDDERKDEELHVSLGWLQGELMPHAILMQVL